MGKGNSGKFGIAERLLLAVGVACLLAAGGLALREALFLHNAVRVMGSYTDEAGGENGQGGYDFVYVGSFLTKEGQKVSFTVYTHDHELPEHQPVPLLYDPAAPGSSVRLAEEPSSRLPITLSITGACFTLLGGAYLLIRYRK